MEIMCLPEKTMKAKIFDWQDVVPITPDKDNKLWVVIKFWWEA